MSKSGKDIIGNLKGRKQEPETTEVENTGNYLRTLRLGKGLSIKDVTEATRISGTNLNAIEDLDFSSLPANTFTRGLLNIYANFLGADAEAVVTKFMAEREKSSTRKRRSRYSYSRKILAPKRLAEPAQISSMTMAGILLLFIVVTFTGYCVYTSWNPFIMLVNKNGSIQSIMKSIFPDEKPAQDSPSSEEIIIVPVEQSPVELTTAPETAQEAEEIPSILPGETNEEPAEIIVNPEADLQEIIYTITLNFLKDTSIELTRDDDDTIVMEFEAGDQTLSAGNSITVIFSQPDSAEILVNNASIVFPESQEGNYTLQIPQDIAELQQDE
jgi:cytoskeletal protein RodZ